MSHEPDAPNSHFLIRTADCKRGVQIRCANQTCGLTDRSGSSGHPLNHQTRFLGVFFPDARCYIKCSRCKMINRIEITSKTIYMVEIISGSECPDINW